MVRFENLCAAVATLWVASAVADIAGAQSYPTRPIKLMVPFASGGQPDIMGRLVAQHAAPGLGTIVIENRQGAGGTLGAKAVAAAEPDGHTLLLGTTGVLANGPVLFKDAGYDPVKSFAPVALVSNAPFVLVVAPDMPARSVAELVAYAKASPGKLSFGAATGTPPHLACEMFKRAADIDILRVPYTGTHVAGFLGGQTQILCEATSVLLPHIRSGKMRPLAVLGAARSPDLPDVPTMAESGLPGLQVNVWVGVVAPSGTPEPVIALLNRHINAALRSDAMRDSLAKLGAEPRPGAPRDFAALISAEAGKWAEAVRLSGARVD